MNFFLEFNYLGRLNLPDANILHRLGGIAGLVNHARDYFMISRRLGRKLIPVVARVFQFQDNGCSRINFYFVVIQTGGGVRGI